MGDYRSKFSKDILKNDVVSAASKIIDQQDRDYVFSMFKINRDLISKLKSDVYTKNAIAKLGYYWSYVLDNTILNGSLEAKPILKAIKGMQLPEPEQWSLAVDLYLQHAGEALQNISVSNILITFGFFLVHSDRFEKQVPDIINAMFVSVPRLFYAYKTRHPYHDLLDNYGSPLLDGTNPVKILKTGDNITLGNTSFNLLTYECNRTGIDNAYLYGVKDNHIITYDLNNHTISRIDGIDGSITPDSNHPLAIISSALIQKGVSFEYIPDLANILYYYPVDSVKDYMKQIDLNPDEFYRQDLTPYIRMTLPALLEFAFNKPVKVSDEYVVIALEVYPVSQEYHINVADTIFKDYVAEKFVTYDKDLQLVEYLL
jgi:hypothetical protein